MTEGDGKIFSKTSPGETSFSHQNALKRLAAGLRPNLLGELSGPQSPSHSVHGHGMDISLRLSGRF